MKREQIVELIKNHAYGIWIKNDNPNQPMADEVDIMELADAILALPLDMPDWHAIESKADDIADCMSKRGFERGEWLGFKEGAGWAIAEIIKRNK